MRKCWTHNSRADQAAAPVVGGAWPGFEVRHNRASTAGVEGAGGAEGPGCGAPGRRSQAGLRADAPSAARGADGSRAGRRPRRSPALTCGNPAPQMRDGVSPTQSGGRV